MLSSYLLALLFALHTQAYKIDSATCGDNAAWLGPALAESFDMASNAFDVLNTDGGSRSSNENRLIDLLFCGPNDDPATVDLTIARSSLGGVGAMAGVNDGLDTAIDVTAQNDFILFCDMKDRVAQNERGEWIHKRFQQTLQNILNQEEDIPECIAATDGTLAVTWKSFSDLGLKSAIAALVMPLATNGWPLTAVDAMNLLDKVLLHEMTHTKSGGETEDATQGFEDDRIFGKAYGWRNAIKLAGLTTNALTESAQNNADTLALFASGIRLLRQDPAVYIKDDGSLTKSTPVQKRGALPRELQLPTTSVAQAAFETFITLVRERQAMQTAEANAAMF